jgi:hypothetical protein
MRRSRPSSTARVAIIEVDSRWILWTLFDIINLSMLVPWLEEAAAGG